MSLKPRKWRLLALTWRLSWSDSSCWHDTFDAELCCGKEFGERGHPVCFDLRYTFERCCESPEQRAKSVALSLSWSSGLAKLPPGSDEEFDYVVIGAGSGGSTAATALASHWTRPTVLLLEAGDWDNTREYYRSTVVNVSMNSWARPVWWLTRSVPPFGDYSTPTWALRSGRALGGSSAVNKGLYFTGSLPELSWALCWPEQDMRSSFWRLDKAFQVGAQGRGFVGPVHLEKELEDLPPFVQSLIEAFRDAGVPPRDDYNDPHANTIHGVYRRVWLSLACPRQKVSASRAIQEQDLHSCRRMSAYSALTSQLNGSLPNLVVRPSSLVTKLRIDKEARKLRGVEVVEFGGDPSTRDFTKDLGHALGQALSAADLGPNWAKRLQRRYKASARRATILAAGAIGSPALLLRSGYTKSSDGEPIGRGLRDRLATHMIVATSEPCRVLEAVWRDNDVPLLFAFFNVTGDGKQTLGQPGSVEAELNLLETCVEENQAFSFRLILQKKLSRAGRVHVASPHPWLAAHAELHAGAEDMSNLLAMIHWIARRLLIHPKVQPMTYSTVPTDFTDDGLREHIRKSVAWYQHPTGTLANPDVVDFPSLRMKDLQNVFVADGSVLPDSLPSGHPDVTIRMIGESLAQSLLR